MASFIGTLSQEESQSRPPAGSKPDYIFDDQVFRRKPALLAEIQSRVPVAATKAVSQACNNVKQQLIVGPMRSAAHWHFHQDALNMLYVGTKRWWLLPPGKRITSNAHLSEQHPGGIDAVSECTQRAGDLMYVPHLWSHAVANIQATVALATEFSDCDLALAKASGWA